VGEKQGKMGIQEKGVQVETEELLTLGIVFG
jgi:hypothetical protein